MPGVQRASAWSNSPGRTRRSRSVRLGRDLAAITAGIALVVVAPTATPSVAAASAQPATQVERKLPNTSVGFAVKSTSAKTPAKELRKPTWPNAAVQEVAAATGDLKSAPWLRVKDTPFSVRSNIKVTARIGTRSQANAAGVDGLLVAVSQPAATVTGTAAKASAAVQLDYKQFADAAGAGFGERLRLVRLPSCALTTPEVPACQQQTQIPGATNDARVSLLNSGDLSFATKDATLQQANGTSGAQASESMVLAAVSGDSSAKGTFAASSLSPAGSWTASGATGAFSWSYPLEVPDAAGDVTPEVSLGYDSGSVDGRVASTNNQSSWVGEGWDYDPGFIERTYRACNDDLDGSDAKTYDRCWAGDMVTLQLGGKSTALVRVGTSNDWKPASDDGTKVERKTGASNGVKDGEHWKVSTPDGLVYHFGLGGGPGRTTQAGTGSAWGAPTFGDTPDTTCKTPSATSNCSYGWRWNLDYVEDTNGNAALYYYAPEDNYYGPNKATTGVKYIRGGTLSRIEYGLRNTSGSVYGSTAQQQVTFTVAERCISTTFSCSPTDFTTVNAPNWPDVPQDLDCNSGAACNDHSPSFWSTKRLAAITTWYRSTAGSWVKVDNLALTQSLPAESDPPALRLDSLVRTGYAADGASQSMPAVTFTHQLMDNRVDGYNTQPPMLHWRLTNIVNETGAIVAVTYTVKDCSSASVPSSQSANTRRCFPVYWTLPYQDPATKTLDYFHKYLVTQVRLGMNYSNAADAAAMSPDQITKYTYLGDPAWHYDDNELVKPAHRTWGQFRGYQKVETRTGSPANLSNGIADKLTLTRTHYFRGMDQDNLPNNGRRTVAIGNTVDAATVADKDAFAGMVRETETFNGDGGARISTAIEDPILIATTATRTRAGLDPLTATVTGTAKSRAATSVVGGTARTSTTTNTHDNLGRVTQVTESGDGIDPSCTRTVYADNTTVTYQRELTAEVTTSGQACPAIGTAQTNVLAQTRTYYDGSVTLGHVPSAGDPTRTDTALDESTGVRRYATTTMAFDILGRPTTVTDPVGGGSTTQYTPAGAGALTKTVVTTKATVALNHVTTTTYEAGRGSTVSTISPGGARTEATYDQLGRTIGVWEPGQVKGSTPATTTYAYQVRNDGPQSVTTTSLIDTGTATTTTKAVEILDAFGQSRQVQTQAEGGRTVTDSFYDSLGQVIRSNNRWYTAGVPSTTMVVTDDSGIDSRTLTAYDGDGREVTSSDYQGLTLKSTTRTIHGGDRTTIIPPTGGTPTTSIVDVDGRQTELRRYSAAPTITGDVVTGGTYQATTYHHDPLDRQDQQKDAAGNTWATTFDLGGRAVRQADPDTGVTTTKYDDAARATSITGARGLATTRYFEYDLLGRKTKQSVGSGKALRGEWVYDTRQVGQPTSSTSYPTDATGPKYVTAVTGYTAQGRPTGTSLTIPETEGALKGTYTSAMTWTTTGLSRTVTAPASGGLPAETLTTDYNSYGDAVSTTSATNKYVTGTTYSPYHEPTQLTLRDTSNAWITLDRDLHTRRLARTNLSAQIATPQIDNTTYTYDASGNLLASRDVRGGTANAAVQHDCYRYDLLGQLTMGWASTDQCAATPTAASKTTVGGARPYFHSWTYDQTGGRKTQSIHTLPGSTAPDQVTTYTNGVTGHAHAADKASTVAGTATTVAVYGYDASGNTTNRIQATGNQTLTWDEANRLTKVDTTTGPNAGNSSAYVYDADGNQLLRRDAGVTTLFMGGQELALTTATGSVSGTRYYSHGGATVAVRTGTNGLDVLYSDQHDSNKIALDWTTNTPTRRTFDPFGNELGATVYAPWPDKHGFLNKPHNTQTGLTDIGARKYDPILGRFLSVDPILDGGNPSQWNGYAYASNNPTSKSDPSGLLEIAGDRASSSDVKRANKKARNRAIRQSRNRDSRMRQADARERAERASLRKERAARIARHKAWAIRRARQLAVAAEEDARERRRFKSQIAAGSTHERNTVVNEMQASGGGVIGRLPTRGSFPFEPRKGQRLSDPKSISRKSGHPVDKYGDSWEWDPEKEEFDVQTGRDHTNVGTDGEITHKGNNTGRQPKTNDDSSGSAEYGWVPYAVGGVAIVVGVAIIWTGVGTGPGAILIGGGTTMMATG